MDGTKSTTKGVGMFQVTEKAKEMIEDFFKDKEGVPYVRIFLAEGG